MKRLLQLLPVAVAWACVGCHREAATPPAAGAALPEVAVRTAMVENLERPASEEVVGTVRAKLRAAIEPKVSGRIEALLVAPGQTLQAGQLIAQLDGREIQARLDQALAVRDQALRDLERARELLAKKLATQAEFDGFQARERVASGAVKEAETVLGYTRVVAPFAGVVTRKLADVGDLAAPGKPIIEMEDPRALRFEADVPEALISSVKPGARLPVRVSADAAPIEGVVVEMAPVADPASRTFPVKLDLPPLDGVRSGQFGRVWVRTGVSRSIRVPAAAVIARGQLETVFVVATNRALLRLVRTGRQVDGHVEVLAGLEAGERIVIAGGAPLRDGQPVTLQP